MKETKNSSLDHIQSPHARREPTINHDGAGRRRRNEKKSKSIKQVEWTQSEPFCLFFSSCLHSSISPAAEEEGNNEGEISFSLVVLCNCQSGPPYTDSLWGLRKWARIILQLLLAGFFFLRAVGNRGCEARRSEERRKKIASILAFLISILVPTRTTRTLNINCLLFLTSIHSLSLALQAVLYITTSNSVSFLYNCALATV